MGGPMKRQAAPDASRGRALVGRPLLADEACDVATRRRILRACCAIMNDQTLAVWKGHEIVMCL